MTRTSYAVTVALALAPHSQIRRHHRRGGFPTDNPMADVYNAVNEAVDQFF